jgi:hypothetical protein
MAVGSDACGRHGLMRSHCVFDALGRLRQKVEQTVQTRGRLRGELDLECHVRSGFTRAATFASSFDKTRSEGMEIRVCSCSDGADRPGRRYRQSGMLDPDCVASPKSRRLMASVHLGAAWCIARRPTARLMRSEGKGAAGRWPLCPGAHSEPDPSATSVADIETSPRCSDIPVSGTVPSATKPSSRASRTSCMNRTEESAAMHAPLHTPVGAARFRRCFMGRAVLRRHRGRWAAPVPRAAAPSGSRH